LEKPKISYTVTTPLVAADASPVISIYRVRNPNQCAIERNYAEQQHRKIKKRVGEHTCLQPSDLLILALRLVALSDDWGDGLASFAGHGCFVVEIN
jgi:hypothetical protein